MKQTLLIPAALLAALVLQPAAPACAQGCEKPVCAAGEAYRDGFCYSGPTPFGGYKSHRPAPACDVGWTLDPARGMCVKQDCCVKPACLPGETYRDGYCYRGPSGIGGYLSHYAPRCEAGWYLDRAKGTCVKKGCPATGPGTPPGGGKPDLVIRSFSLVRWGQCAPGRVLLTFGVTVANVGTAASPAITGQALVQVMDQHPLGWGNGALLGSIPPGGTQSVLVPVYYLMANPDHMTAAVPHPFKAIADPLRLVDELNEANNESGVVNVGAPTGCSAHRSP